jgi:glycerol-3-phosphate dehydrogenase subunit C
MSGIRVARLRAAPVVVCARAFSSASGGGKPKEKLLRRPVQWKHDKYYDEKSLEEELRRVSDICHGCRRCFNLCDSFPALFKAVDAAPTEELDTVPSATFKKVADACTLCDMCFTTKCPYTPPHEFDLDFPHLILRYRAQEERERNLAAAAKSETGMDEGPFRQFHKPVPPAAVEPGVGRSLPMKPSSQAHRLYANQDLAGPLGSRLAPIVNTLTKTPGSLPRKAMEKVTGIDARAPLPAFASPTFVQSFAKPKAEPAASQRKVVLYATCFVNHNRPSVGEALVRLLHAAGVHVEVSYPECCGMPQLEQGLVGEVAGKAERVTRELARFVDDGFEVVALTPSCTLMLRQEWPLLLPENAVVSRVGGKTLEASELVLQLVKSGSLALPKEPMPGVVTLHNACHARAQNIGFKSRELLALVPQLQV